MSPILKPFRQLIDRRLWPVALLLVAALAAVPLLLGRSDSGAQATTAPPPATTADTTLAGIDAEPIVSPRASGTGKTLGRRRDPFTPAVRATKQAAAPAAGSTKPAGDGGGGGKGTGGTPDSGDPKPGTPADTPEPAPAATPAPDPAPKLPVAALAVRFGPVDGPQESRTLLRLTGLPRGTQPGLLYLGVGSDRRSAVFLVDAAATVEGDGDGSCQPAPDRCQRIVLRRGDIEFVTVGGTQYQLEVREINTRKVSATAARRLLAATAHDGRDLLRDRLDRVGGLRYDEHRGTLSPPDGD